MHAALGLQLATSRPRCYEQHHSAQVARLAYQVHLLPLRSLSVITASVIISWYVWLPFFAGRFGVARLTGVGGRAPVGACVGRRPGARHRESTLQFVNGVQFARVSRDGNRHFILRQSTGIYCVERACVVVSTRHKRMALCLLCAQL